MRRAHSCVMQPRRKGGMRCHPTNTRVGVRNTAIAQRSDGGACTIARRELAPGAGPGGLGVSSRNAAGSIARHALISERVRGRWAAREAGHVSRTHTTSMRPHKLRSSGSGSGSAGEIGRPTWRGFGGALHEKVRQPGAFFWRAHRRAVLAHWVGSSGQTAAPPRCLDWRTVGWRPASDASRRDCPSPGPGRSADRLSVGPDASME